MTTVVPVALARDPYDVVVGPDAILDVGRVLAGRRHVAIVTQAPVAAAWLEPVVGALDAAGVPAETFTIPDGEVGKGLDTVAALVSGFARHGLLRGDAVLALGGGVVGDVAGFSAAVYHRGIDVVQIPTTLLAQVDSAIGGKTGVNLPEGKNLVGAFHQPRAVLADTRTLATLPERDFRSGLGEVAKYALMFDVEVDPTGLVGLLRLHTDGLLARDADVLETVVACCARIKADVVAADEFEEFGLRATLNYGHTFAHALETVTGHKLLHGEAVAIGLVFAIHLAASLERVGLDAIDRVHSVLFSLGLPLEAPEGLVAAELVDVMRRDKKASGGLTFVLPGPAGLERVDDPPAAAVERALRAVGVQG
jgi:3-dehydroquinate synthase